jgi:hypothetical protein
MPQVTPRKLTLLVPGLFGGTRRPAVTDSAESEPRLPALETFLARADRHSQVARGAEARVFALFGVEPEAGADLPVAAVTRVLDLGVIDTGWWLRADPVHLVPDRDRLVLHDSQSFELTQDEATRLAAEIGETYAAEGWILKAPRPGRWYLKPPRAPRLSTTPLPEVVGRDIHPYLPQGPDGKAWHTLLNELQILLHTARMNSEREQAGKPPINSLWFWGGGRLPSVRAAHWSQVWSLEAVSLGLARLCEIPVAAPPDDFSAWQRQTDAQSDGAHLVVLDEARASLQYGDRARWREVIRRLERDWFVPMFAALGNRQLQALTVLDETGPAYELTPRSARRWWRRPRRVAQYAAHR